MQSGIERATRDIDFLILSEDLERVKQVMSKLMHSDELRKTARISSKRWLEDSRWKPVTIEEYIKFLDEIQSFKKELNAPDLPHPKMKGDRFSI